ncbi:MAG: GNAT family N-acetyltransferase [Chloroflexota bacterium]
MSILSNPLIRTAEVTDVEAMKQCVELAYKPYISRIGKPPGPMLDDYVTVVKRHLAFVAEWREEIIGILVLIQQENSLLLDNVAVHPSAQGKGVGRLLMAFAEAEACRRKYSVLDLYTHEHMTENITLYERLGYVERERRTEMGYQRVYMRKTLPEICDDT